MRDHYIIWRLINDDGVIVKHRKQGYDLGLDMLYSQGNVEIISNEEIRSRRLRLVSSVVMTMLEIPGSGGLLEFTGKSHETVQWSPLRWQEDNGDNEIAHHMLMRFGDTDSPDPRRVRRPDQNCPSVMRYLFQGTELISRNSSKANRNHACCAFRAPVGIFWGMVGLRSLNCWGVVPELIGESSWLRTELEGGQQFDSTPYQPLHAVTPGIYLQVHIVVPFEQPELQDNYFKYKIYGEIDLDDYWLAGEEEECYPDNDDDDDDDDDYDEYAGEQTQMVIHQSRGGPVPSPRHHRSSKSRKHQAYQGSGYSGSHCEDEMMSQSYDEYSSHEYGTSQRHQESSKTPTIPEDLRLEDLYISRTRFRKRDLKLNQNAEQQMDLLWNGTGLVFDNELSSVEDLGPQEEQRRWKQPPSNQHHRDHHEDQEDDDMGGSPGESGRYSNAQYSGRRRLAGSGPDYRRWGGDVPRNVPFDDAAGERQILSDRDLYYQGGHQGHYSDDQEEDGSDGHYDHHGYHYQPPSSRRDGGYPSGGYPPEEAGNVRQWEEDYHEYRG